MVSVPLLFANKVHSIQYKFGFFSAPEPPGAHPRIVEMAGNPGEVEKACF